MTLFNHPAWITAIQLQSGVAWACIELATFLMFLEHLRDDERTSWISFYYLGNTIALVLGSMLGGLLIARLGSDQHAYEVVFWIATGLRALALILVVRVLTAINAPEPAQAASQP
jgi:MFS family permease